MFKREQGDGGGAFIAVDNSAFEPHELQRRGLQLEATVFLTCCGGLGSQEGGARGERG